LLNFFKKYTGNIISVIIIFLIFILVSIMVMSCTDNFKIIQKQLKTAEIDSINTLTANSEDTGENDLTGSSGAGDNGMENPAEEIIKEDAGEEQEPAGGEEIEEENDDPGLNDTGDIDFSNSEDFKIEVDLSMQMVFVFYKDSLIKEMICSGGTEEKPTPPGEFRTSDKGLDFWSDKYNMRVYYWIRFYNEYLFHSVPFDEEGNMIEEEYEKLGSPASHGCIRLKLDDAEWLYEKLPSGVRVRVYQEN